MKQDEVNRQDVFIQSNHITIDTVEVFGTYLLLNRLRFLITWHYVDDTRIYHLWTENTMIKDERKINCIE